MSKFLSCALVTAFSSSLLLSSAIPIKAEGVQRTYSFNKNKQAYNEQRNRVGTFNFFDVFSSRKRKKEPRKIITSNAPVKSPYYSYRPSKLVLLGDGGLKQPHNQTIPLFADNVPKNFDPTENLVAGGKLDDSLAQTIFEVLKASNLSTKVTKQQKQAIVKFYKARNFKSAWTDMDGAMPTAKQLLGYLAGADSEGLKSADYLPSQLTRFNDSLDEVESDLESIAQLDINLTAMAVRYGQHASGGRIIPNRLSGYHDLAPPKTSSDEILANIVKTGQPEKYLASLQPHHKSYVAFKKALAALDNEPEAKKYPHLDTSGVIKIHHSDKRILQIRQRLQDIGMLAKSTDDASEVQLDYFDEQLVAAVKEFQKSKALPADGVIGKRTLSAFNGRKKINRRNALVMNMERLRWLPRDFGSKYVFVNQASFKLQMVNDNRQVWQTRVVVGKPKNQTSFFIDKMETVVFNPYWGVPQSIITKEMLPRLRANPGYLDQRGFEVYTSGGRKVRSSSVDWYNYGGRRVPFSVRQPPSSRNALGKIKFLFPNKHAIYLHDTPSKSLFQRSSRAFSHGCVRVKNPFKLAENILGWDRSRIDKKIATGKNGSIRLKKSIPVYIAYFTAWADKQGKVNYFSDVYGRDSRLDRALNQIAVAEK